MCCEGDGDGRLYPIFTPNITPSIRPSLITRHHPSSSIHPRHPFHVYFPHQLFHFTFHFTLLLHHLSPPPPPLSTSHSTHFNPNSQPTTPLRSLLLCSLTSRKVVGGGTVVSSVTGLIVSSTNSADPNVLKKDPYFSKRATSFVLPKGKKVIDETNFCCLCQVQVYVRGCVGVLRASVRECVNA